VWAVQKQDNKYSQTFKRDHVTHPLCVVTDSLINAGGQSLLST